VGVEAAAVERHVLVGVPQRPPEAFELQRPQLVHRHALGRVEQVGRGCLAQPALDGRHSCSFFPADSFATSVSTS
jgi:hypothetical protein